MQNEKIKNLLLVNFNNQTEHIKIATYPCYVAIFSFYSENN